jgi:hypothetical protein
MEVDLNESSRVSAPRIFEFTIAVYIAVPDRMKYSRSLAG